MKAAIYARVSTGSQKEKRTIQSQLDELPVYAESQGWEIFGVYKDEGISGSFISGREDFIRLLDDMEHKKFEILLVAEHSRVTRTEDPEERGRILALLKNNKIKLASPHEGILDLSQFSWELMTTLKPLFASEEKAENTRRMKGGKRDKLRNGSLCIPRVPFPFRRETDRTVKPAKHTIIPNEEEVEMLKIAYDQIVVQGQTIHHTADYLNRLGYKPRKAKIWSPGTLHAVLRNKDTLTGNIVCNKYNFKMIGQKKFQNLGLRPESEWIKVPVQQIFTELEYKRLDKRLQENRRQGRPNISGDGFLLSGQRVRCSYCGRVYGPRWNAPKNGPVARYYACNGRTVQPKFLKPGEKKCNGPYVNQGILDDMVWNDLVMKLFMFPDHTLRDWNKANKVEKGVLKRNEDKLRKIDKDIEIKKEQAKRLLNNVIVMNFDPEDIVEKKKKLDKVLETLNDERSKALSEISRIRLIENNKKAMTKTKQELKNLTKTLSAKMNNMAMADKQRLIEYFIPNGSYIEIVGLHPDDYHYVDLGKRKRIKVTYAYTYHGVIDLTAVVQALKSYHETKEIPSYNDYLTSKGI